MGWSVLFSAIGALLGAIYFGVKAARLKANWMDKNLLPTGCEMCHGEGCPDCKHPLEPRCLGKHVYEDLGVYVCKYCNEPSGLSGWQIVDMPPSMAICPMSPVRRTIWERMSGKVDCLAKPRKQVKPAAPAERKWWQR